MAASDAVDNFTNDSAMMIAWERALESKRPDALFVDPLAEALAGTKGETLSAGFGNMSQMFGFEDWAAFHKTWVAVRTRFIDDRVKECACGFKQLVNLGAGMDTRPYRLECYKAFANGSFNVDMKVVNDGKARIFERVLQAPAAHCPVHRVDLDFKDEERTLATELGSEGSAFDAAAPALFIAEGLIMYLGALGKINLLKDVSAVAAPGSVFVLQYMDASESEVAKVDAGRTGQCSQQGGCGAGADRAWVDGL